MMYIVYIAEPEENVQKDILCKKAEIIGSQKRGIMPIVQLKSEENIERKTRWQEPIINMISARRN